MFITIIAVAGIGLVYFCAWAVCTASAKADRDIAEMRRRDQEDNS